MLDNTVFPDAQIQLCIVHMMRNSLKFALWKDYKAITVDFKCIFQSIAENETLMSLKQIEQ
jgi:transposase-like protein